jgi:hypothetical protein
MSGIASPDQGVARMPVTVIEKISGGAGDRPTPGRPAAAVGKGVGSVTASPTVDRPTPRRRALRYTEMT